MSLRILSRSLSELWQLPLLALTAALAAGCGSTGKAITGAGATSDSASTSASSGSGGGASVSSGSSGSTGRSGASSGSASSSGTTTSAATGSPSASGSSSGAGSSSSSGGKRDAGSLCFDCRHGCPCPASAQLCEPDSGLCSPCLSNADCAADAGDDPRTPSCNLTLQACTVCASDGDCHGATPWCGVHGQCLQCRSASDCAPFADAGQAACELNSGRTLYGRCGQCTESSDCPGQVCDTSLDQCVPTCADAGTFSCPFGCDVASGLCISAASCQRNSDCATAMAPPLCNLATRTCVSCLSDQDCRGNAPYCQTDPASPGFGSCYQCVGVGQGQCDTTQHAFCSSHAQAPASGLPAEAASWSCAIDCRQALEGLDSCDVVDPMNPLCDPRSGRCVECRSDADCQNGPTLYESYYLPPARCDRITGQCLNCRGPGDCPYSAPSCYPINTNGSGTDSACNSGATCAGSWNCPLNQLCTNSACHCADDRGCGGNAPSCESPFDGSALPAGAGFVGTCGCQANPSGCPAGTTCNTATTSVGYCTLADGGVVNP